MKFSFESTALLECMCGGLHCTCVCCFFMCILLYDCCRKLVCRVTTPDLMFGQMVAPPPSTSSTKTCMDADDLLQCFHDTGSPVTSELSPITVPICTYIYVSSDCTCLYVHEYTHVLLYWWLYLCLVMYMY